MGVKSWVKDFYSKRKGEAKDSLKRLYPARDYLQNVKTRAIKGAKITGQAIGSRTKSTGAAIGTRAKAVGRGVKGSRLGAYVSEKATRQSLKFKARQEERSLRKQSIEQRRQEAIGNMYNEKLSAEERLKSAETLKQLRREEKESSRLRQGFKKTGSAIGIGAKAVGRGATHIGFLLIIAIALFFLDGFSGHFRSTGNVMDAFFPIYTIFGIIVAMIFYFRYEIRDTVQVVTPILVYIGVWAVPFAVPPDFAYRSLVVTLLTLAGPIYFMFFVPHENTKFLAVIQVLFVIFFVLLFYQDIVRGAELISGKIGIEDITTKRTDFLGVLKKAGERFVDTPKMVWDMVKTLPKQIEKGIQTQIALATGDYYTGKVDKNANEQLGVYLEKIQQADPELYEDESVTVWANLKARTLDKDKPVNVSLECWHDEKSNKGKISPEENYMIYTLEEEEIDCYFDKYELDEGSHSITFSADFNFETMSYLKSYFMDKERKRAMRREEIDIFKQFQIKDKKPVAIYTVGPVMIGMEIRTDLPVGIDRTKPEERFVLGITLENDWEGKIKDVTNLTIIPPEHVKLIKDETTENYCYDYKFIETCENEVCEYKLDTTGKKIGAVETFISLRCPMVIAGTDYNGFLGDTPLSVKYFKVTADYQYITEESININVKEGEFNSGPRKEDVEIDTIVLHHTAGGGDAEDVAEVLKERSSSVHYVVDKDGIVTQLLPEDVTAYHAGCCQESNPDCCPPEYRPCSICVPGASDMNHRSIGIEMINTGYKTDVYKPKLYDEVEILIDGIIARHDSIKKDREHIKGHYEVDKVKWDPGPNFDWSEIGLDKHPTLYDVKGECYNLVDAGYPCPEGCGETCPVGTETLEVAEEEEPSITEIEYSASRMGGICQSAPGTQGDCGIGMKCYFDSCSSYTRCYQDNIVSIARLGEPCNEEDPIICSMGCEDELGFIIPVDCADNVCVSTRDCNTDAEGTDCSEGWFVCTGETRCDDTTEICVAKRGC